MNDGNERRLRSQQFDVRFWVPRTPVNQSNKWGVLKIGVPLNHRILTIPSNKPTILWGSLHFFSEELLQPLTRLWPGPPLLRPAAGHGRALVA